MSDHLTSQPPTINDVARLANTSKTTVSRYINGGRVKKETEEALKRAIRELNYMPNVNARRLALNKTMNIAVVVDNIDNPFFSAILSAIESVMNHNGYECMFHSRAANGKQETDYLDLLHAGQVDGLILASFKVRSKETIQAIRQTIQPVVLIGENTDDAIYSVDVDNYDGIYQAVQYLYRIGHRKIAYISGPDTEAASFRRLEGFMDGMNKHRLKVNPEWVVATDWSFDGGRKSMNKLLEPERRGFTAVVAASDRTAIGAIHAAQEQGFDVPTDFSVVGFDDFEPARWIRPTLTTFNQPCTQMGEYAAQILYALLEGKDPGVGRRQLLKPKIAIRHSSRELTE